MVQVLDTLLPIHMIIQIYASIGFKPNNEADEIFIWLIHIIDRIANLNTDRDSEWFTRQ